LRAKVEIIIIPFPIYETKARKKQKQGRNKSSKAESSIGKICHQRFSFPLPLRHSSLWPLLPFFLHRQSLAPPDFQSISFFLALSFIIERKA
jgi:hypothetical protein